MARRESTAIVQGNKTCYFYTPLTTNLTPVIAHDNKYGIYDYNDITFVNNSVYLSGGRTSRIKFESECPIGINLTFNCWLKKTGDDWESYSFGSCGRNDEHYYGLQYHGPTNNYSLVCEYCYFCQGGQVAPIGTDTFVSWTIIYNGNSNYTCKLYKDGIVQYTKTFTNTSWKGMGDQTMTTIFAIAHNIGGTMKGYYKHFSCFEELTDSEILELYQNGGIVS